ncbi:MAG: fused MFS/spermidine synthase [Candidatus Magnetoovum sp. WYHC-5]|nr:fused MFS/spermidine synthase [Candidatus Magnetoovum sp. WYHC-5]
MITLSREEIIYYKKSRFNDIVVTKKDSEVILRSPFKTKQSVVDIENQWNLCLEYTRHMLYGLSFCPQPEALLCLGLGAGALPRVLAKYLPKTTIDIVEIDPEIVYVANTFFNFKVSKNMRLFIEPCEVFVKKPNKHHYNIIFNDAYIGNYQPNNIIQRAFYKMLCTHLAPAGILVCNVISDEPTIYKKTLKSISSFLPYIYLLHCDTTINTVVFASRKKIVTQENTLNEHFAFFNSYNRKIKRLPLYFRFNLSLRRMLKS